MKVLGKHISPWALLTLGLFSMVMLNTLHRCSRFKTGGKYAVGIVTETKYHAPGSEYVHYYFRANGTFYSGEQGLRGGYDPEVKMYLVVFDSLNPSVSFMLLGRSLSDLDTSIDWGRVPVDPKLVTIWSMY